MAEIETTSPAVELREKAAPMPDTTDGADRLTAYLAGIRTQAEDHPLVPSSDVRPLLAAVDAVLHLAEGAHVMLANCETGQREPVAWDLAPEAIRAAISAALLGEGASR